MSTDQHAGSGSSEASGDHGVEIASCDDVLSHVFEFLDRETDDARRAVIAEHLEDCSPCLRQFGIEQEFKALVRRRCGGDPTPVGLRDRIKLQLTSVSFEEDGTQVWVERTTVETITTDQGERP
ncbi:mycothiol system anti-sigma-R factor [Modestobacter lapidis]|nr:mycothiol system anti-sigma-R factor [Modestobacter lapidis]